MNTGRIASTWQKQIRFGGIHSLTRRRRHSNVDDGYESVFGFFGKPADRQSRKYTIYRLRLRQAGSQNSWSEIGFLGRSGADRRRAERSAVLIREASESHKIGRFPGSVLIVVRSRTFSSPFFVVDEVRLRSHSSSGSKSRLALSLHARRSKPNATSIGGFNFSIRHATDRWFCAESPPSAAQTGQIHGTPVRRFVGTKAAWVQTRELLSVICYDLANLAEFLEQTVHCFGCHRRRCDHFRKRVEPALNIVRRSVLGE